MTKVEMFRCENYRNNIYSLLSELVHCWTIDYDSGSEAYKSNSSRKNEV
jgi:hypothetical protein